MKVSAFPGMFLMELDPGGRGRALLGMEELGVSFRECQGGAPT